MYVLCNNSRPGMSHFRGFPWDCTLNIKIPCMSYGNSLGQSQFRGFPTIPCMCKYKH